jgi:hypothetical protein
MAKFLKMQKFDVFQTKMTRSGGGFFANRDVPVVQKIDTVFYHEHPQMTLAEVKRQLIEHDGYPADITVKKGK